MATRSELVVAWDTAWMHVPGEGDVLVRKGTRLRVSHPWVKAHPSLFVAADTPDNEWPSPFAGVHR